MIEFRPGEWEGIEGMAEEVVAELRTSAELAVDRAGLYLEGEVKRTLGPEGGARTGRTYPASKTGPDHQASAPGEPPAVRDGGLRQSITHSAPVWDGWNVSTEVGTNLEYARILEWGGVVVVPRDVRVQVAPGVWRVVKAGTQIRILPRPYFAPAILRAEPTIERILEEAVKS